MVSQGRSLFVESGGEQSQFSERRGMEGHIVTPDHIRNQTKGTVFQEDEGLLRMQIRDSKTGQESSRVGNYRDFILQLAIVPNFCHSFAGRDITAIISW